MSAHAAEVASKAELWGGGRSPFSVTYGKLFMWFFLISDALTFGGLLTSLGFYKHKYADIWPASEEVFVHFPFTGDFHLPLLYVALMTFILIVSSVTMVLAVEAGHRMDKKGVVLWLGLTVVGGFFFLFSQVWEWSHYIHGNKLGALKTENMEVLRQYDLGPPIVAQWTDASKTALRLPKRDAEGNYFIVEGAAAAALIADGKEVYGANLKENEYGSQQYADFFFFVTGFHGFHVLSGVVINIVILIMVIKGMMHRRGHYEMVEKTGLYWHFVDLVWVFVFTFYYLL
ncbi:MAG: cytochrome oxidase subunit III [Flavobacteriales bacterium]|nr:MAG: cytochrome oxidase subunit III [Flavobacteriales bacterium]